MDNISHFLCNIVFVSKILMNIFCRLVDMLTYICNSTYRMSYFDYFIGMTVTSTLIIWK